LQCFTPAEESSSEHRADRYAVKARPVIANSMHGAHLGGLGAKCHKAVAVENLAALRKFQENSKTCTGGRERHDAAVDRRGRTGTTLFIRSTEKGRFDVVWCF
jgi:hypothetical protein